MDKGVIELKGWWVRTVSHMLEIGLGPVDLQTELCGLLIKHAESIQEMVGHHTEQGGVIGVFEVLPVIIVDDFKLNAQRCPST